MIDTLLFYEYEAKIGPLDVNLTPLSKAQVAQLESLLRDAIDGRRGPVTDADLGSEYPAGADI